jgi:L-rhamnose mutarotase
VRNQACPYDLQEGKRKDDKRKIPLSTTMTPATRRLSFTLDLKNDLELIAEYKKYHEKIWPEITESIRSSGIVDMEIYLLGTRMFMIMEVDEAFSPEKKAAADRNNPKVQEWEQIMCKFQQSLPDANPGEKWLQMERIFKLQS